MERIPGVFCVCVLLLALGASSLSDGQNSDFHEIMHGPVGRPVAVKDEADNWSTPILVYADSDVEIFIPDITGPGWLAWHVELYRQTGQYSVPLFEYYKSDRLCLQGFPPVLRNDAKSITACKELAYDKRQMTIDTRLQTAIVGPLLLMRADAVGNPLNETGKSQILPLSAIGPRTTEAIARTSAIVAEGSLNYTGLTAREALEHDQDIQRKMVMNLFGHDCAPHSDSQAWKNWHSAGCPSKQLPPYDTPSLASGLDKSGITPAMPEQIGLERESGPVFRAGGDISAPRPIFTPDAEYSSEARKRKVQGTCGLSAVVRSDGHTQDIRVTRSLGSGLDEKAVEALKTWMFEPGRRNGEPVAVRMDVNMTFRLFVSPTR